MSGPPTPPPSSALEIEDAARTTVLPETAQSSTAPTTDAPPAATEQPAAPPQPVPSIPAPATNRYRQALTAIVELANRERFDELTQIAESADLNVTGDNTPERLLVTAPLVLAYLILDDIPPATHALSRLPNSLSGVTPLPKALLSLVAAVSGRKYQLVYSVATKVHEAVQTTETPDVLKSVVNTLLDKFIDGFRRKTFELLSRAYTSVPLPLVQSYLSLPAEQILQAAEQFNWGYDATTQTLSPTVITPNASITTSIGNSTLSTFNAVAGLKLE